MPYYQNFNISATKRLIILSTLLIGINQLTSLRYDLRDKYDPGNFSQTRTSGLYSTDDNSVAQHIAADLCLAFQY